MYEVILLRQAQRYFERLDKSMARRLSDVFKEFEALGYPEHSAPLQGELAGLWRLRVGDFRVIFEVNEEERRVNVLRIGPRGDVYKR